MTRNQKLGMFGVAIAIVFSITPVFQNCAKVNYGTKSNEPDLLALASRKVVVDTATEKADANVKILIVVDDSFTMSQSQQLLSNSIDSLLNPLKGHFVNIKVVSTSGVPNNALDYSSDVKYFNPLQQQITQVQATSLPFYFIEKRFDNLNARNSEFEIKPNQTDLEFSNVRSSVKQTILNMGTNGSDAEEGLCAVARQMFDGTASSFFKAGDKAIVIVISDEDDSSKFENCTYRKREKVSSNDVAIYKYLQQRARLKLEVQNLKDGLVQWLPLEWGVSLEGDQTIVANTACSDAHKSFAVNKIVSLGYQTRNVDSCMYEAIPAAYNGSDLGDSGSANGTDFCSQALTFNNKSYTSLYQMINATGSSIQIGSCLREIQTGNSARETVENSIVIQSDAAANSAKNISLAIYNKAGTLFGESGFFFSAIVHKLPETCVLSAGQSLGLKYSDLTQSFDKRAQLISICEPDYSPSLAQLSGYVVDVITKTYQTTLSENETIIAVVISRGNESIRLGPGDYAASGNSVTFTGFSLQLNDKIEIYISTK